MSDPRKSFVCDKGHVVSDTQRPWGKQSACRCCEDVFVLQRDHAKSCLTTLQYHGGPYLTPADHVKMMEMLTEVFGDYSVGVPIHATGQWGFKQWASEITHGRW